MTRLTWTIDSRGTASAQVGVLWLSAGKSEDGSCWWLLAPGNRRSYGAEGRADSLADAQAAAEEAALSLALDVVAALAPDPSEDEWLSRVIDHDETFGVSVEATSLDAGDRAERLGCALIRESREARAALRARKETDR